MDLIDSNDRLEQLITLSIRLGEQANRMHIEGVESKEEAERMKHMEEESERLWNEAKKLGRKNVRRDNYEDLANAILTKAVTDYEELISGTLSEGALGVSKKVIEDFLKDQNLVRLNMSDQLKYICHTYYNKMIPYVKAHNREIAKQWDDFDKLNYTTEERIRYSKHRCPVCGGSLRPIDRKNIYNIGCTGCSLSVYLSPFETKEAQNVG